jgi:hypothetical protein
MGLYVVLTIWLFQKGSSESKPLDEDSPADRPPSPTRQVRLGLFGGVAGF